MRRYVCSGALIVALITGGRGLGAEPGGCEPREDHFLSWLHAVGGWSPYGGGLLRWWNAHCFYCGGAPDDYCRKPLPRVCTHGYPSYYTWGPQEICYRQSKGPGACGRSVPRGAGLPE